MFFKQIDYISPSVTFYHKGLLSHSSTLSGILSLISFILILTAAIYFSLDIIKHQNPQAFYFNRFSEDAGIFPLNSSSLFHFISLHSGSGLLANGGFDFKSFRAIGLESYYFQAYKENKNLSKIDHWLYGYCLNETETVGINHLINYDFFLRSACVRKYFSSKDQKYYDIGDSFFKWPVIAYGTFNSNNKFYSIILEKCEENTLNLIEGEEKSHCKNNKEIKELIGFNGAARLFFIDNYIDVLNYENPITKFFYRIENTLQQGSYPINHLNFNPTLIKTHNGLVIDNIVDELSYSYERNDVFTYNDDINIYTVYYFWLNNRINYYERSYKRIQEIISNIGGIYQFITFTAIFLNSFYHNYILLIDTQNLLSTSIFSEKYNLNKSRRFPKTKENLKKYKSKSNTETEKNNTCRNNEIIKNRIQANINEKDFTKSKDLFTPDFIISNNTKLEKSQTNEKNNAKKENNIEKFWNFILFKLSLDKNSSFEVYQNFRRKIISEEHLIRNHLSIYNLIRVNEKKINSKKRYSYQLKDLINLV